MADNVNDLFTDLLYKVRTEGVKEETRNGPVLTIPHPTLFSMENPRRRVLFNPERKANPYFHVMETVWMFAGSDSVEWLKQFNQGMLNYAEPNGLVNGAYGSRWRKHFKVDQIENVVRELQRDQNSRQAVISMYDPTRDYLSHWKDRPCNTTIYFRTNQHGNLDMTICNRSNDLVWGACGANAVHMSYLQELVASAVGMNVGRYYVMSNNLHLYEPHWGLLESPQTYDRYTNTSECTNLYPLLGWGEDYETLLQECEVFTKYETNHDYHSNWINNVVIPMYEHYMCRLNGDYSSYDVFETLDDAWCQAERDWRSWND